MFGRKSFLETEIEAWHVECWAWLIRHGSVEGLAGLRQHGLVLPTPEYFPATDAVGHARAEHVFDTVRALAGMQEWPVRLIEDSQSPASLSETVFLEAQNPRSAGTFSYDENDNAVITYDPIFLDHPAALVLIFAHELGHYRNGYFDRSPPDGEDLNEPATDVTATFLGFGLFGANCACEDYVGYSKDGVREVRHGKLGYHTEAQWIFDLAIFCNFTGTDIKQAKPHLKPHLWSQLKKAASYVQREKITETIEKHLPRHASLRVDEWSECQPVDPDVLTGQYALLERLNWDEHGAGLHAAVCGENNVGLWTYMPDGPFLEQEDFVQTFEATRQSKGWETLVIRSADRGAILGMASYMRIRPEHGSAEVGCVTFGPDLKRTRAATEAIYLMSRYVFDELGYRRFEWKCDYTNVASRRAAERFGFQFEGVFRNDMVVKGRNRDTGWFAMTDDDWPRIKLAYEKWLLPENFDEGGMQKARLACRD